MRRAFFHRFRADESGANSIEYAMIACVAALFVVGLAATGLSLDGIRQKLTAIHYVLIDSDGPARR